MPFAEVTGDFSCSCDGTRNIHGEEIPHVPLPDKYEKAGKHNWIVVTRDERIRYRVAEKQAVRRAKVRAFVLAAQGDLRAEMLAEIFLKALPKVRRVVKQQKPPFIAKISRGGEVTLLEF